MSDQRQGVTEGVHHILDLAAAIHSQRANRAGSYLSLRALPVRAHEMAAFAACPAATLQQRRADAAHAAANLIAFVELADLALAGDAQAVAA